MRFIITVHRLDMCVLSPKYPELEKFLMENMKVVRQGYEFIDDVNDYIKYIYFYDNKKCSFGYGYIDRVMVLIDEFMKRYVNKGSTKIDYSVEVIDNRPRTRLASPLSDKLIGVTLRPYQQRSVEVMEKKNASVLKGYMGCGKTIIMSELIRRKSLPTLVITDGVNLVKQDRDNLEKFLGIKVGLFQGKTFDIRGVTMASIDTLNYYIGRDKKYLSVLQKFMMVIVDEAHGLASKRYQRVCNNIRNCRIFYSFSGTPETSYQQYLAFIKKYSGSIDVNITADYLIKNKYISEHNVFFVELPDGSYDEVFMDYPQVRDSYIVNNDFRNQYICSIANLLSKRGLTLIMVQRIPHAKKLYDLLKYTDRRVRMISGETSTYSEREEVIEMMRREELDIVICTDVIQKGIDIKPVQNVILAGGGKAYCAQYQRIGRGSRPFGDGVLNIVTFIDNDCSARKYLRGHSLQMKKMLSENKRFTIKTYGHQEFLDKLGRGHFFNQRSVLEYDIV